MYYLFNYLQKMQNYVISSRWAQSGHIYREEDSETGRYLQQKTETVHNSKHIGYTFRMKENTCE
jgi:hypothetical protein